MCKGVMMLMSILASMDSGDSFHFNSLYKFLFTSLLQFCHNYVFKQIGVIRSVLVSVCVCSYMYQNIWCKQLN